MPFVLPLRNSEHYDNTFKSYNIPELSPTPVPFDAFNIRRAYQKTKIEQFTEMNSHNNKTETN